jgi:ribonuclease VapC
LNVFIDASALLAILLKEPEANRFSDAMEYTDRLFTSPIAIYETVAGLVHRQALPHAAAEERVYRALHAARIEIISITADIGELALAALEKYGKGRGHKAQLNMGDCFAYACAKSLGVPLLYKGNDFSQTDLA